MGEAGQEPQCIPEAFIHNKLSGEEETSLSPVIRTGFLEEVALKAGWVWICLGKRKHGEELPAPSAPLSLDPIVPIVLDVQELEGRTPCLLLELLKLRKE